MKHVVFDNKFNVLIKDLKKTHKNQSHSNIKFPPVPAQNKGVNILINGRDD